MIVCSGFLFFEDAVSEFLVLKLAMYRLFLMCLLSLELRLDPCHNLCLNRFGLFVQHFNSLLKNFQVLYQYGLSLFLSALELS